MNLGTAIVVFCVIQSFGFLLALSKNRSLIATMLRWRPHSSVISVAACVMYWIGVVVCFSIELYYRVQAHPDSGARFPYWIGFFLRLSAVGIASCFFMRVFVQVCREEEALIRDGSRKVEIPRVPPPNLTAKGERFREWLRKLDKWFFRTEMLDINEFYKPSPWDRKETDDE